MDKDHQLPYRHERTSNGSVFVSDKAHTMNDLRRYRIGRKNLDGPNKLMGEKLQGSLDHLFSYGVLVTDTTLADIASAHNLYHTSTNQSDVMAAYDERERLLDALGAE